MIKKNQLIKNLPNKEQPIPTETDKQEKKNLEIIMPNFNIDQSELIYIPLPKKMKKKIQKSKLIFWFNV